jgi:hypothetical protein
MNGRRLLLVTYAFPPIVNAQAIRWLMLVRALTARGVVVEVLTTRAPAYFQDLLDEIPASVTVHRTWAGPIEGLARAAKAGVRSEDDWFAARRSRGPRGLGRQAYRLLRRVADGALIPDLCSEWLPFAVARGLALVRQGPWDALVSTSEPGVDHLAASVLKRRTGLPWLADFGDPWVNQNTPTWRTRADTAVERSLADAMDGATVTTSRLAALYQDRYAGLRPIRVVRQGFDADLFARVAPVRRPRTETLNLVYTGTLYSRFREPTSVFEGLRLARGRGLDVVMTVAGRMDESVIDLARQSGVADVVDFAGIVPYKSALSLQKGADVLLHLDNEGARFQVPGKLYEYLGAGRPILVVRHGPSDESTAATCVRTGRCGRDVASDPEAIAEALTAFDVERRGGRELRADPDFVDAHSFARSADELCLALEEAIGRNGSR